MLPPFGPTQANVTGSDTTGNYGGDARSISGYGNSQYGARAYGESINCKYKSYIVYSYKIDLINDIN